jgi:transcription termination factor NusB
MAISDSKRRELCSLVTFRQQFDASEPEQSIGLFMEVLAVTKKNVYEAIDWWRSQQQQLKQAQQTLAQVSQAYTLDRLGQVELAILSMAAEEILRQPQEGKRIVSDAIRLARKYATPEAGALVNALLDGLCHHLEGANVDETEITASVQALEKAEADAHEVVHRSHSTERSPS